MTADDKAQDRRLAKHVVSGGRLRSLVLELWQRTRIDWSFVTDRLSTAFRDNRWIGAHERRFVAETLFGLVRHLRRIDAAIAAGGRRGAAPRDLDRLLALLVIEDAIDPADAAAIVADIDWTAARAIDDAIAAERDRVRRIAIGCSMPDWLARMLVDDWGDEAEPLARGLNQRAPMTVRANLLRTTRDALAAALAAENLATTPGRFAATALIVDTRTNLFGTQAFARGEFEAQDEGSQLIADLATPTGGGGVVVDLCAGAGGKTLAIAAAMSNKGRVFAYDIDDRKLAELRRRAKRAGVTNVQSKAIDPDTGPDAAHDGKADVVLIDAPCTGTGALRRNPEARWRLSPDDVPRLVAQQRALIERAIDLVAPGGRLVYATCSVLRAENDGVVDAMLSAHRSRIVTLPLPDRRPIGPEVGTDEVGERMIVTPHHHGTDGFFARILQRTTT
jgi:16S rRNA (cytosine967-C5)-methyltransferase